MMEYKYVKSESLDVNIQLITINRPDKMNALNMEVVNEIKNRVMDIVDDPNIKGAIITGTGEKSFVAGADISEFAQFTPEEGKKMAENGHAAFNVIQNCPKPIIAAINGFALGGGCELAMACHIRVASENASFGQPEVALGIIPGYGGTQRMLQVISKGKAMELLMTGDMITSAEALKLGLVNYVTPAAELIDKATSILNKILKKGPLAIAKVIKCVNAYYESGVNGFQTEIDEFGKCFNTEDYKEGTTAFTEKRKAEFTGR